MAFNHLSNLGDLGPFFSFIGWWFLPGYLSGILISIVYRILPSWRPTVPSSVSISSDQKPVFNPMFESQKAQQDWRARYHRSVAHGIVICVYLGYTLTTTYQAQDHINYYSILGLNANSLAFNSSHTTQLPPSNDVRAKLASNNTLLDEAALKSHWRKLARAFHPDKLNPPQTLQNEAEVNHWKGEVESKFIEMREAYETLSDITKQWAYDRFGPTIAQWKNCITMREYLMEGAKHSSPFYAFTLASLVLLGGIRKSDPGSFWRWTLLMLILAAESIMITSTSLTLITLFMSHIFPNRTPFEHIELLRKIFIAGSCVVTQLSGILYPIPDEEKQKKESIGESLSPLVAMVKQIEDYSSVANVEVVKLMFNDLHPIVKNDTDQNIDSGRQRENDAHQVEEIIAGLKEKMLDTFCDLKLQSDPAGQTAWIEAVNQ
ncbi:hypothetical protein O181_001056 [Austropuccinia psidii MF-1]|uniref:J domain-containing protein n=1 Tax=Austropuccinia psidii MF-1 TaxID=1389203 RepID=A0A9Q3B9M1_9BASI|nr:hypothetical protein [Austropuccinia psidii MF-1]